MTKKEFLQAVSANKIDSAVIDKANELLAKMEEATKKASKSQLENKAKNIELAHILIKRMDGKELAASEITEMVKDLELKVAKVNAVLQLAEKEGLVTSRSDYRVGGKGAKVKGWKALDTTFTENNTEDNTEDNVEW